MAVILNGDTVELTGFDAFKYEYNAHKGIKGIIKGIIGFFLGRKVTLAEGRSLLKDYVPEYRLSTVLSERSVQELAPADETQLTKRINPKSKSSSVSINQSAQLTADRFSGSESNVWEGRFYPNPSVFPGFKPQPPTHLKDCLFPHEKVNEHSIQASPEELITDIEKKAYSKSELPDEFDHVDISYKKQIRLLGEGSDFLKTPPKPLDKSTLAALGLSLDFPDQEDKIIMDWLDSSDFMDKTARPETATLVKHIIHRCVHKQNKDLFIDICASLGSRAGSKLHLPIRHKNLYLAFFAFHKHLLSNDDQSSGKACRVIGMCLINELDSYLKEIEPPETREKTDWHVPNVRWMDQKSKTIMAIDENQLIDISHGGGRYNLKKFLNGQISGYPLERCSDTGIQVHPHYNSVDGFNYKDTELYKGLKRREIEEYSLTSLRFLDLPARLTAKIPAKHMIAANNVYECGITASSVSELVEPKITVLNRSLPPEASDHQELET